MKRPHASTDLTGAEEAGLAGMEPLTSMPAELGLQGFPSGGQMCIGDAGLGNLSMPGQEGFLSSVSSSATTLRLPSALAEGLTSGAGGSSSVAGAGGSCPSVGLVSMASESESEARRQTAFSLAPGEKPRRRAGGAGESAQRSMGWSAEDIFS